MDGRGGHAQKRNRKSSGQDCEHPHQAPDPFFHSPLWIKLLDLWSWGVISATSLLHIPKRSSFMSMLSC
jgi:hypothetical protein